MKPQLNDLLRIRFFAQYLDSCDCGDDGEEMRERWDQSALHSLLEAEQEQAFLFLRPISGLTDEEAIRVAEIVCRRHNLHYQLADISYRIEPAKSGNTVPTIALIVKGCPRHLIQITSDGIAYCEYWMGGAGREHYYCPGQYEATQYLLSIGIALPFMGHSVEDIVTAGWVRLIDKREQS